MLLVSCDLGGSIWELAPRIEGPKYKTDYCENEEGNSVCRFGKLCKFKHHTDFVLWLGANLYLLVDRRTGSKAQVLIQPKNEDEPGANPYLACASGLFDMATECLEELADPAVMRWLQMVLLER